MQELSDRTLLMATYVIPGAFSLGPISIHAFGRVSPWLLCIVIAHASFNGNCCLSWNVSRDLEVIVTVGIGTHFGKVSINDGPV